MKILLVNIDKGWGGGQELMAMLAEEMRRAGCAVHFLCRSSSPSARAFADLGFRVHTVAASGIRRVAAIVEMAAVFRRERFDVVLVSREHDLLRTMLGWQLAFPVRKPGKFVMCYHTATSRSQPLLGLADLVVCISTYVWDRLRAGNGNLSVPVEILPNGIRVPGDPSPAKFTLNRERRFFKGVDSPLIGMAGAFFKNQGELIDAIALMVRDFPTLRVALVGDDGDAGLVSPLRSKIRERGVADNVVFTGKIPHERMADVFHDLDLSVSTYRNEGFGLVHLESLAAGTPVVAYAEGGQVDIFRGSDAGVLVNGGPTEFAAVVAELLRDHGRRFAMGRRGHELVQRRFSVEAMGEAYISLFKRLLRTGGGE